MPIKNKQKESQFQEKQNKRDRIWEKTECWGPLKTEEHMIAQKWKLLLPLDGCCIQESSSKVAYSYKYLRKLDIQIFVGNISTSKYYQNMLQL